MVIELSNNNMGISVYKPTNIVMFQGFEQNMEVEQL